MAEQHLKFQIGSAFNGEGFKQAREAVGNVNPGAARAAEAAEKLSSAMGGLDTSATKAFGALSSMLTSIMSLNVTAIVTQGALIAINFAMEAMQKEAKAAEEKANALRESVERAFDKAMKENVSELAAEIKTISGDFERVTKHAEAFTAALNGLKGSIATGGIINLEIEKINAMSAALSEEMKSSVEAEYNFKIATAKAAASREEWTGKIEAADAAVAANRERTAIAEKQLAAVQEARAEMEETLAAARQSRSEKAGALADRVAELTEQEAALTEKLNAARDAEHVALISREKTLQDAANAEAEHALALETLKARELEQAEAAAAKAKATREAAEAEAARAEILRREREEKEEEANLRKEAADIQRDLNKAAQDRVAAEKAYSAALAAYKANFTNNVLTEELGGFGNGLLKGGTIPVTIRNKIEGRVTAQGVEDALKNGVVNSVKELRELQNKLAGDARQETDRRWTTAQNERRTYERLRKQSEKARSEWGKKFMADYEKVQAAAEMQKKDLEEKEARLAEAKRREEKMRDDIEAIAKKLNDLGLK